MPTNAKNSRKWEPSIKGISIRQGEILSNVLAIQRVWDSTTARLIGFEEFVIPYAVVLTQDCDLEQDVKKRFPALDEDSDKLIPSVLMAQVWDATVIYKRVANENRKLWDRLNIERNGNPRFQFLQQVAVEYDLGMVGLPEMVIDFKKYLTIPTHDLYRSLVENHTQRRCILVSPYLEHLSHRFAYFVSRVGLPEDHLSD